MTAIFDDHGALFEQCTIFHESDLNEDRNSLGSYLYIEERYIKGYTRLHLWALHYASMGIPVHPLYGVVGEHCTCRKGAGCERNAGKHPHLLKYRTQVTTDFQQINKWWRRWPEANIGMPTGRLSGMIMIDLDNQQAIDWMKEKEYRHDGPLIRTGKGYRLVFRRPNWSKKVKNRSRIIPAQPEIGLDILADGGNAVMPPSMHYLLKEYRWAEGRTMADYYGRLPHVPDFIASLIKPKEREYKTQDMFALLSAKPEPQEASQLPLAGAMPGKCRTCNAPTAKRFFVRCAACQKKWRKQKCLDALLGEALDRLKAAGEGKRNDTLVRQAFYIGQLVAAGSLTQGQAEREIERACTWSFHETPDNGKSIETMQNALEAGYQNGEMGLDLPLEVM